MLIKQISIVGVRTGEVFNRDPNLGRQTRQKLFQLLDDGVIDPYVCASIPLEDATSALELLQNRRVIGKAVVAPDPSALGAN